MRNLVILGVLVAALTLCMGASTKPSAGDAKAYAAAVADSSRPTTDSSRDADRKPAETLAFAHIKAGDKVADYAAGGGYFTRMFLDVVGPKGHVYAVEPDELKKYTTKDTAELQSFAATH